MLLLDVRKDKKIVIKTETGRIIEISVVNINGGIIKLGFEADKDILIDREEIAYRKGIIKPLI